MHGHNSLKSVGNFLTNFKEYSKNTVYKNPSSGSRVFPCGQTGRQADMTKLIVAFRKYATVPKNYTTSLRTAVKFVSKRNCNISHRRVYTEQVAWAVSILTCTAEVPGSDAHQHVVSSEDFRGFTQCLKANSGVGHDGLLSQLFKLTVCLSQNHLMLLNLS